MIIFDEERIRVKLDDSEGAIIMENPLERKIQIDCDLTALLGLIESGLIDKGKKLKIRIVINLLTSFSNYLIHCILID